MLNKNLRTVLYYVVSISCLCLMIEFSKRIPDPRTSLSPQFYEVVTAKQSDLLKLPTEDASDDVDEDIIPKRNRGREKVQELIEEAESENEVDKDEKERFREWKKTHKFKPSDTGLFRKWKKEVQRGKLKPSRRGRKQDDEAVVQNEVIESVEEKTERPKLEIVKPEVTEPDEETEEVDDNTEADYGYDNGNDERVDTDELIDYPGGITEYAPPLDLSCAEFEMTDELRERSLAVREACDRLEPEMGSQRILMSRLRWAVPERLLYCPVFKAASTSWLVNYLKLSNSTLSAKSGNLHKRITDLFPPPATFKLRKKIFAESLKFLIVRHPFERLVSAYRDKLAGFSRNDHYLDMRKHIISRYRKDKSDKSAIPSFRESVDFVLDELKKMELGSSHVIIDGHFMPYTRRCIPCAIDYDVIIKFETLEEDSQYLIEQCHLEDKLKVIHENAAPTGARTPQGQKNKSKKGKSGQPAVKPSDNSKTLEFFKDIDKEKIKQLYEHYKFDFQIFDYSAEEYF